ncbi:LamG-like jellyroll fold domain-containing protein [Paenibacillus sacheonensis]|uniref:LamG-like jellyroll fold domain-containing protein n=1 Tax=Paenibacillus sacheonensis TaxID=742054 RepID=A0A7X4YNR8_9BACL|nr:LamG-like jellyroll fold domain-containing protein [Paenibacillus sacheonensis]MBM7565896.1 hypothetical protein [Paenibacillus sacheonensis]NBC68789.1 hypothetical protein [Paenibacillus sacheonensis]
MRTFVAAHKRLSAITILGFLVPAIGLTAGPVSVSAATSKTITVDFNDDKGAFKAHTGFILTPNYDVPDGRIVPLKPEIIREDSNEQGWLIFGRDNGYNRFNEYEYNTHNRFKNAYDRATKWGAEYYPLLLTNPSFLQTDPSQNNVYGMPTDLLKYKQWVKDFAQFAKDNSLNVTYWDSTNEPEGSIGYANARTLYNYQYEAIKEVNPNAKLAGPSSVWNNVDAVNALIDQVAGNGKKLDVAAWHELTTGDAWSINSNLAAIKAHAAAKPAAGVGQYWVEEYQQNGEAYNASRLVSWLAAIHEYGYDLGIRSTWNSANSASDYMVYNDTAANNAARQTTWWTMKAYAEMSGRQVGVTQDHTVSSAIAAKDTAAGEAKILVSGLDSDATTTTLNLNNQPFAGSTVRIDKYKVTGTENDGLQLQATENPSSTTNLSTTINMAQGDVWLIVIKKAASAPGSFVLQTPDDGVPATTTPTLTWQQASGATGYTVKVSTNYDLSSPVINTSVTTNSYTVSSALTAGQTYYWSVTATNANGSLPAANGMVYSFIASSSASVPSGRFSLQVPVDGETGTPLAPVFGWTNSYGATSYRLQVSTSSTFASTVIDTTTNTPISAAQGNVAYNYTPSANLTANTTYYARVYAVNASGSRIMNGPVHVFKTGTTGAPPSFTLQSPASGTTGVSVATSLKWNIASGAFFYKLTVDDNSDFSSPEFTRDYITTNGYTFAPNELFPNKTYYWKVTASTKDRAYSTVASNSGLSFTTDGSFAAGPVGEWIGNELSGNTVYDSSGGLNNGTLSNVTRSNDALVFNGTNSSVNLGNPSALNFTGKITMSAWIKPSSITGAGAILYHQQTSGDFPQMVLRINGSTLEGGSYSISSGTHFVSMPLTSGDLNVWMHVALTYDGTAWRIYKNGVLANSSTDAQGAITVSGNWTIGATAYGDQYYSGSIKAVKIFNTALNGTAIGNEMNKAERGHWVLGEGTGTTANDTSGNGSTGTVNGASWVTGRSGYALQFNGTGNYVGLGSPSVLNFSGKITMSAWIKPSSITGTGAILYHQQTSGDNPQMVLRINGSTLEGGSYSISSGLHFVSMPLTTGDLNVWMHVALTYDGTAWRIYKNGVLVNSSTDAQGAITASGSWMIGATPYGDQFFSGQIYDARVYNYGLSDAAVAAIAH